MMYGQEYGPWNALADVLGAYMQKKDLDGALNYAQNVGTMVDKATAPKMVQNPVKPEQYGTQAAKKAEQYLVATGKMPNPDWLGQNVQQPADAATRAFMNYVPQGVQAAQPANGSIMAAAQNAIQPTGQNFSATWQSWSATNRDTIGGTLKAAGLTAEQFSTEEATMSQLRSMSESADGQMRALQVGHDIAAQQVAQMQKLRGLVSQQMTMMGTWLQTEQTDKDLAQARREKFFNADVTTIPSGQKMEPRW